MVNNKRPHFFEEYRATGLTEETAGMLREHWASAARAGPGSTGAIRPRSQVDYPWILQACGGLTVALRAISELALIKPARLRSA